MQTSTRRGISFPSLDRSDRPDIPAHIKNLVDALELDASTTQGTAGTRPANPGYARWFYWATDTKVLSYWDGSVWTDVGSTDLIAKSLIDAKGDLIVGVSNDTASKLGVGSNGFVLTADNGQSQGLKWALPGLQDLIGAKGDLLVGTAADIATRLAVGSDGQGLIADAAQASGVRWGSPVLSFNTPAYLTSDVTMTNANQYYDGPTQTCVAGIWVLIGRTIVDCAASNDKVICKLWDGVGGVIDGTESTRDYNNCINIGIVTPSSTTTYKTSAKASTANAHIRASTPDSIGSDIANKMSCLYAIKIG